MLVVLAATAPYAFAADSFVSLDCPLLAGSEVTAYYYEDGAAKCASMTIEVTAPDGTVQSSSPLSCSGGRHVFPRYAARQAGNYSISAVAPRATAGCFAAGVSVQRRKVPEFNPFLAIAVGIGAILIARRHGL